MSELLNQRNEDLKKLGEETEVLKREQKRNLDEFSAAFKELQIKHNELTAKNDNLEETLNIAVSGKMAEVKVLKESVKEVLAENKKLRGQAYTLHDEAEELKNDLNKKIVECDDQSAKNSEEYADKKETLSKKVTEADNTLKSLNEQQASIDSAKENLDKEKVALNKRASAITLNESGIKEGIKKENALIKENRALVKKNKEVLGRISKDRTERDHVLHNIQDEKSQVIKKEESVAFREKEATERESTCDEREASIARGEKSIEKRMGEADALYKKWKEKLAKGEVT